MNVILYTIDCPSCIVLEKKLKQKNVDFVRISDKETLFAKGLGSAHFPILEVNGLTMEYNTAIEWLKNI